MLKLCSFLVSFFDIAETPIKPTQKCVGLVVIYKNQTTAIFSITYRLESPLFVEYTWFFKTPNIIYDVCRLSFATKSSSYILSSAVHTLNIENRPWVKWL